MRYQFQFTSRLISHRNEWLFRIYIILSQNFVPERNSRSGTTTGVNPHQGDSPWHDLWWWYHETNTEPQEGTGVILDVSYWRCGGVPSERMKSSPGVEPRTCRCWVRARIGKRSRFPVQGLLDDWHQLDMWWVGVDAYLSPGDVWYSTTHAVTEGNQPAEKADPSSMWRDQIAER